LQAATSDERKRDTREKIQLGGLVVKAGLRDIDKAVILGALLEAAERLKDQSVRARYEARGKEAFGNGGKEDGAADRPDSDDGGDPVRHERY
jgi:hypothetical protein